MADINGNKIKEVWTRKTMYDNDCVRVVIGSKDYFLHVDEIKKLVKGQTFTTEKKTKHTYLHLKEA